MCVCVSEVPTTTPAVITTGINTNTNVPCQQLAYHYQRRYWGRSGTTSQFNNLVLCAASIRR